MSTEGTPAGLLNHSARGGKYLTFFLADEEYGIEILKVQEIIGLLDITMIPRAAPYIRGVINLRGKVIPIIDLRLKFGMAAVENTEETCIIVVRASGVEIGVVVDRVSEVLDIASSDIDAPPSFGCEVDTSSLLGIAKADGRIKLLLAIDQVLAKQEVIELPAVTGEPA
jgi:purine-binding chemotaxis protein CheW